MRFRLNLRTVEGEKEREKERKREESTNFLNAGPRDISWPPTLLTLILYTMTSEIVARPPSSPSFRLFRTFKRGRDGNGRATFLIETFAFLCSFLDYWIECRQKWLLKKGCDVVQRNRGITFPIWEFRMDETRYVGEWAAGVDCCV